MTVSVCTESPLGGDRRWLLNYGEVTGLQYDKIAPGGSKSMQGKLLCGPNFHDVVMAPGRIVKAFIGPLQVWDGRMDEPTPEADGISFTATGNMAEGDDYAAVGTTLALPQQRVNALSMDASLDAAIARGMAWTRTPGALSTIAPQWPSATGTTPGLFGYEAPTDTINTALQAAMNLHGWPWYVLPDGTFFWFQWPTAPSLMLTAISTGGGRTRDGMVTDVAARYNDSSGNDTLSAFSGNAILRAVLGRKEKVLDLTSAGNQAAGSPPAGVTTAINNEIAQSGQRAAWTGSWPAPRGLLRTMGGAIVDPAVVVPGLMVSVQLTDAGVWGETSMNTPTFVIGQTSYDADSDSVALTPLQSSPNSLPAALRH